MIVATRRLADRMRRSPDIELPMKAVGAGLRKTTERLACELARPTLVQPDWCESEWLLARAAAAMHGVSSLSVDGSPLAWPSWLGSISPGAKNTYREPPPAYLRFPDDDRRPHPRRTRSSPGAEGTGASRARGRACGPWRLPRRSAWLDRPRGPCGTGACGSRPSSAPGPAAEHGCGSSGRSAGLDSLPRGFGHALACRRGRRAGQYASWRA